MTAARWGVDQNETRNMLQARRRELTSELELRVARLRDRQPRPVQPNELDEGDDADLDVSLLEIAASTLQRIDAAIRRLDSGRYGLCALCDGSIAESRLRALPFAVHCRDCETTREVEAATGRRVLHDKPWRGLATATATGLDAL